MNQMELTTHECLQFFLPRLTVALENIAEELKRKNEPSQSDTEPSSRFISKREAYCMLDRAGIPVMYRNDTDDIALQKGDLLIGTNFAFFNVVKNYDNSIGTAVENAIEIEKLTKAHIQNFITEYKTLEKEILK